MGEEFTLIRSRRRTVNLQIDRDGRLVVRAPLFTSQAEIRRIVEEFPDVKVLYPVHLNPAVRSVAARVR